MTPNNLVQHPCGSFMHPLQPNLSTTASNLYLLPNVVKQLQHLLLQSRLGSPAARIRDLAKNHRKALQLSKFSQQQIHSLVKGLQERIQQAGGGSQAGSFADQEDFCTLVVRSGDCLSEIAKISKTPVEVIQRVNKIEDAGCLRAGQALLIPRARRAGEVRQWRPGPWRRRSGRERRAMANLGDSLWSLADVHRVSLEDLRAANGFPQGSSHLEVGQEVVLPRQREKEKGPPWAEGVGAAVALLKALRPHSVILPLQFALRPAVLGKLPVLSNPQLMRFMPLWKPERFGPPVEGGWLSSHYGWKDGRWYFHKGIDIAVEEGTPVMAATSGQVTYADWKGGYGKTVCMDHGDGYASLYAHNSELLVKPGQVIRKGSIIALSGNTGYSTGPHLHFEIHKNGLTMDPLDFIPPITQL